MAVCQPAACPGSLNPALPCTYIPTYLLHDSQRWHCFESKGPGIWPELLIPYQNSLCWREILSINDYFWRLATLDEAPLGGTWSCYPNKSQKSDEVAQRFLYAASRASTHRGYGFFCETDPKVSPKTGLAIFHLQGAVAAKTQGEVERDVSESSALDSPLSPSQKSRHAFEPLIGSPEAAKLLGNIHVKTLQRYARRGSLPGYQIGGHWFFRQSELDAWLRSRINSSCHPCRLD